MIARRVLVTVLAAGALYVAGMPARAQEANYGGLNAMDHQFAQNAAAAGLAKIKLGQLAQDKGQNAAVKNYGKLMVNDYTKSNDQLKKGIFAQENLPFPTNVNDPYQVVYNKLSQLSGAAFDQAYAQEMLDEYTKDIAEFELESGNGQDLPIKNYATQTLPTLKGYLKTATQMLAQVEPAGAKPKASR